MDETELALRAAINVLRDSIESARMPSGQPLPDDALDLHRRAAEQLEAMLRTTRLNTPPANDGA